MLEIDRRVLAETSEPVSVHHIVNRLMRDAHSPFDVTEGFASVEEDVAKVVDKLVRRGHLSALGEHSELKSVLRAIKENADTIGLPKVKADSLRPRIESGKDIRLRTGRLYIMSKAGFDALHAPLAGSEGE